MRQREPDGADLLPSRREAVEHAARDDEMGARVVMGKRQAEAVIMDGREDADQRDRRTHCGRRGIGGAVAAGGCSGSADHR